MTPEAFFKNNPEGGLQVTNGYALPLVLDDGKLIRAAGYTDGVLLGPEVKLSKKCGVEWGDWMIRAKVMFFPTPELRQQVDLPDGSVCVRFGKYIDAPEEPKPKLSQFLPDGWDWVYDKMYKKWGCVGNGYKFWCWPYDTKAFTDEGCLPPSEGGGFQKAVPGTVPNNLPAPADLLYGDGKILKASKGDPRLDPKDLSIYWGNRSLTEDCTIRGYRPHIDDKTENKKGT